MYLSSKNTVVSEDKKWGNQSASIDWWTWSHWIVLLEKGFDSFSHFFPKYGEKVGRQAFRQDQLVYQ